MRKGRNINIWNKSYPSDAGSYQDRASPSFVEGLPENQKWIVELPTRSTSCMLPSPKDLAVQVQGKSKITSQCTSGNKVGFLLGCFYAWTYLTISELREIGWSSKFDKQIESHGILTKAASWLSIGGKGSWWVEESERRGEAVLHHVCTQQALRRVLVLSRPPPYRFLFHLGPSPGRQLPTLRMGLTSLETPEVIF